MYECVYVCVSSESHNEKCKVSLIVFCVVIVISHMHHKHLYYSMTCQPFLANSIWFPFNVYFIVTCVFAYLQLLIIWHILKSNRTGNNNVFLINGAKHVLIGLNIEKWCFRENSKLDVFDFKQCDDFSINIQFPSADQNFLKRRTFWGLHFGFVLLKLFEPHASFRHLFFCSTTYLFF